MIELARSFTARDVITVLQSLFAVWVAPEHLCSDDGPEFVAKEIQERLARASVHAVHPEGKPVGAWLRGELQRKAPRRVARPGAIPEPARGSGRSRPAADGIRSRVFTR